MKKKLSLLITLSLLVTLLGGCGFRLPLWEDSTASDNGTGFEINTGVAAPAAAAEEAMGDMAYESYATNDYSEDMSYKTSGDYDEDFNTEEYNTIKENGFEYVSTNPLSTFAADVDTGSYCNLRRMIRDGYTMDNIPSGAVRTEEMVNYFDYPLNEENETDGKFSVQYAVNSCP